MKYLSIVMIMLMVSSFAGCKVPQSDQEIVIEDNNDSSTLAQGKEANSAGIWLTDYEQALIEAKKSNLPILINFSGSDWCSWCIRLMDEVFSKQEFIDYAKKELVLLNLDFPRNNKQSQEQQKANQALLEQYGVLGFPTVILLNSKGEKIGQTGYQEGGPKPYIEHLNQMIK